MNWLLVLVITLAAGGIGSTIIFLALKWVNAAGEVARLKAELAEARRVLSNEKAATDVLVEHRTDAATADRLRDGSF